MTDHGGTTLHATRTTHSTHTAVHRVAAAGAAALAVLYLLTGSGWAAVTQDQPSGVVPPLLVAAGLYTALSVLLLRVQRRWVWTAGAGLQVLLIVMYLLVAAERTPPFEPWGIAIKALQLGLLATLTGLALGARPAARR